MGSFPLSVSFEVVYDRLSPQLYILSNLLLTSLHHPVFFYTLIFQSYIFNPAKRQSENESLFCHLSRNRPSRPSLAAFESRCHRRRCCLDLLTSQPASDESITSYLLTASTRGRRLPNRLLPVAFLLHFSLRRWRLRLNSRERCPPHPPSIPLIRNI